MLYENNWESLNKRPVPEWFADAKFGIFIHWGLYSVPAYVRKGNYSEWYMYNIKESENFDDLREFHKKNYGENFRYEDFAVDFKAELFDAEKWADLFQRSGAKYINITSKHHDGYCLFKSSYAWNWNTVDTGPHRDILQELSDALKKTDVRFGVYHSIYEWYNPIYLRDPEEYAVKHLIPMMKEMIEKYQPSTLFTDGEWDHPAEVWHSTDFLTWLYNESSVKDYIVPNDRWGKGTRGKLGGNYTTEYGYLYDANSSIDDVELDRPFEECRGIGSSFGFNRNEDIEDYLSAKELINMLCDLVSKGGNFLLNIGPAADGTIPVIMQERLLQIGAWLDVNGDGIYGTRVYTKEKSEGYYYTKKDNKIFGMISRFPAGEIVFDKIPYDKDFKVFLLGCDEEIELCENNGFCSVKVPALNPDEMKAHIVYVFKFEK